MDHKVLCIDDENHNLDALERLLRKKFQVVTSTSGPAALQELKNHNFSLIISDQKMPEMTGVEFFMEAKKLQPEAVRILLTGYTDLESVIEAINQGQIYRYITKPWDPEELHGIVAQAIDVFEMKGTIARQNRELQKANQELMSLDKLKTDFMLLVNHELKTPLTGIFSFVQLLNEEKLTDDQQMYLEKITKNTKRLQDLINDTLLITKAKSDLQAAEIHPVKVKALIEKQWQALKTECKSQLDLKLTGDDNFNPEINEKSLEIIIKKSLHNCFTHGAKQGTVEVAIENSNENWSIKCKNPIDGPINKDLTQLLQAFTTSKEILNHSGGSGLGLAVIQAMVSLFNGKLSVSSTDKDFRLIIEFP